MRHAVPPSACAGPCSRVRLAAELLPWSFVAVPVSLKCQLDAVVRGGALAGDPTSLVSAAVGLPPRAGALPYLLGAVADGSVRLSAVVSPLVRAHGHGSPLPFTGGGSLRAVSPPIVCVCAVFSAVSPFSTRA
jgi:hypothetical protein